MKCIAFGQDGSKILIHGVSAAWSSLSSKIGAYRKAKILGIEFTQKDRDKQESEQKRKK